MQERHAGRRPPFAACGPGGLRRNLAPASLPGRGQAGSGASGWGGCSSIHAYAKNLCHQEENGIGPYRGRLPDCVCPVRTGPPSPALRSSSGFLPRDRQRSRRAPPPAGCLSLAAGADPDAEKTVIKCARDGASKAFPARGPGQGEAAAARGGA